MSILIANPEIGLAYSNADYVDVKGNFSNKPIVKQRKLYEKTNSKFANCWNLLVLRNIVPMIFGIFRTSNYKQALPFYTFDETMADVDNLFMFKFFLMSKVHCTNDILFHYRVRYRWADPDILVNFPKDNNPIKVWFYNFQHQLKFTRIITNAIEESVFPYFKKILLQYRALYAFLRYLTLGNIQNIVYKKLKRHFQPPSQIDHLAEVRHKALVAYRPGRYCRFENRDLVCKGRFPGVQLP